MEINCSWINIKTYENCSHDAFIFRGDHCPVTKYPFTRYIILRIIIGVMILYHYVSTALFMTKVCNIGAMSRHVNFYVHLYNAL